MGKSSIEYQMDTLEKNYINGLISDKEYDDEMDALIKLQNNSSRWTDAQWEQEEIRYAHHASTGQ